MRKFVLEKTVIAFFTSSLFIAFFSFANNNQNALFKSQNDSFQHTWKIEQGNYKYYHTSL